jgi:hypothetical protein
MRKPISHTAQIERRMRSRGEGAVFVSRDFLDIGSRASIDQALSRLAREGVIRRVGRGLYDTPRVSERLGITLSPAPDDVAAAVARRGRGRLQIAGAQAANALGLSTQVPAHTVYLTDGTSRVILVGAQTIEFRHASPRYMAIAGRASGTVIQALRHLGKNGVSPEVLSRLRAALGTAEKSSLRDDRHCAPGWMQPFIHEIVGDTPE